MAIFGFAELADWGLRLYSVCLGLICLLEWPGGQFRSWANQSARQGLGGVRSDRGLETGYKHNDLQGTNWCLFSCFYFFVALLISVESSAYYFFCAYIHELAWSSGNRFILGERTASYNTAKVGDGKSFYVEQGRVKVLVDILIIWKLCDRSFFRASLAYYPILKTWSLGACMHGMDEAISGLQLLHHRNVWYVIVDGFWGRAASNYTSQVDCPWIWGVTAMGCLCGTARWQRAYLFSHWGYIHRRDGDSI